MDTFDPESITGLSEEDAAGKLKKEGYNELPSQKKQSLFSIMLNVLREPMLLLLLGAGMIYLFFRGKKRCFNAAHVRVRSRRHNILPGEEDRAGT